MNSIIPVVLPLPDHPNFTVRPLLPLDCSLLCLRVTDYFTMSSKSSLPGDATGFVEWCFILFFSFSSL